MEKYTFEDFSWNDCPDSVYDCTKSKYVWCDVVNQTCTKGHCPRIKEYHSLVRIMNLKSILTANPRKVKGFQKRYGLIVDGIPGPAVKNKIFELIEQEKLNANLY